MAKKQQISRKRTFSESGGDDKVMLPLKPKKSRKVVSQNGNDNLLCGHGNNYCSFLRYFH